MQRNLPIMMIFLIFINIILINISVSKPYELIGDWESVSNDNEAYQKSGWITYSITTPRIAEIKILEDGEFLFASKMNNLKSTNNLHFKNKFGSKPIKSTLEFTKSNSVEVNKNDTLKWTFSVAKGDQIWIAFPLYKYNR